MKNENGNELKTLLMIINEIDLTDGESAENLFSRFPVIQKEGIETLIISVNFLKSLDSEQKDKVSRRLKENINLAAENHHFNSGSFAVADDFSKLPDLTSSNHISADSDNFFVLFILDLGGREELKLILSDFIKDCRKKKMSADEITQERISAELRLPYEPDLILSRSKGTLTDFMLWQTAYSEYYFLEKDLKHLTDSDLKKAFESFKQRNRRYGI
ncbi:undecaprenyl diphosphate synthase family protein [Methanimicrococcus sp. OttesenSCG-928-J09]|nr:undecaprenyl diphosphate synthase family protein [Methanimicrococcus sp. OttesenSCG-928-J09]